MDRAWLMYFFLGICSTRVLTVVSLHFHRNQWRFICSKDGELLFINLWEKQLLHWCMIMGRSNKILKIRSTYYFISYFYEDHLPIQWYMLFLGPNFIGVVHVASRDVVCNSFVRFHKFTKKSLIENNCYQLVNVDFNILLYILLNYWYDSYLSSILYVYSLCTEYINNNTKYNHNVWAKKYGVNELLTRFHLYM